MIEHYYTKVNDPEPYRPKLDDAQRRHPRSAIHLYLGNSTQVSLATHPDDWDGSVVAVRA